MHAKRRNQSDNYYKQSNSIPIFWSLKWLTKLKKWAIFCFCCQSNSETHKDFNILRTICSESNYLGRTAHACCAIINGANFNVIAGWCRVSDPNLKVLIICPKFHQKISFLLINVDTWDALFVVSLQSIWKFEYTGNSAYFSCFHREFWRSCLYPRDCARGEARQYAKAREWILSCKIFQWVRASNKWHFSSPLWIKLKITFEVKFKKLFERILSLKHRFKV